MGPVRLFCGEPQRDAGCPYCEAHAKLAYKVNPAPLVTEPAVKFSKPTGPLALDRVWVLPDFEETL